MRPPEWFVRSLEILDPLLSVRWGSTIKQWVIDRQAVIPQTEIEFLKRREIRLLKSAMYPPADVTPLSLASIRKTYMGVAEELDSALAGRRVILFAEHIKPELYDLLAMSDIKRYGGYARFADAIESKESFQEQDAARQTENKRHALNLEVADQMHYIWRKREDALLNGHRDMRYLLHGKHTQAGDEPLVKLADF